MNKRNVRECAGAARKLRALSRECNGASSTRSATHSVMHYNAIAFAVAGDYWHEERAGRSFRGRRIAQCGDVMPTKSAKKNKFNLPKHRR